MNNTRTLAAIAAILITATLVVGGRFVVMKDNGHKNWIYLYRVGSIRAS
jgi:hypothetical protein